MSETILTLADATRAYRELALPRVYIYFIQVGDDGPIKIGCAKNPFERLSSLQCANHEVLSLRAIYQGYAFEEKQIHEEFAGARIRGEWFHPTAELLEHVAGYEAFYPVSVVADDLGVAA